MPSITAPSLVPEVLCGYLNIPLDSLISRTQIYSLLINKCRINKLLDPNNHHNIIPNEQLREILYMESNENVITFKTFQSYLSRTYENDPRIKAELIKSQELAKEEEQRNKMQKIEQKLIKQEERIAKKQKEILEKNIEKEKKEAEKAAEKERKALEKAKNKLKAKAKTDIGTDIGTGTIELAITI